MQTVLRRRDVRVSFPAETLRPCVVPHETLTSRASRGGHSLPGPPRDARDAISDGRNGPGSRRPHSTGPRTTPSPLDRATNDAVPTRPGPEPRRPPPPRQRILTRSCPV